MARTNLTKRQVRDPRQTYTKFAEHDTAIDALESGGVTLAAGSVALSKLADETALSVLGRSANTDGVPAAIAAASDNTVMRRSGTSIGFGTIAAGSFAAGAVATADIAALAVTISKLNGMLASAPQSLSGAGAINLTTRTTLFTSTGSAQALTLAAGTTAQRKSIIHHVDGGSGVLTHGANVTLGGSLATITFTNVRDCVELEWSGTEWNVVSYTGCTFA